MKTPMIAGILLSVAASLCIYKEAHAASPADTAKASLENYFKAWREPDADKRTELLSTAWVEDGTYTDPSAHVEGRDALVEHISRFQSNPQFKNFSIVRASGIDVHHRTFRFEWEMQDPAGKSIMRGMDYGEFDDDGAITKIVGFFGPFPDDK